METAAQVIAAIAGVGALIAAMWAGLTAQRLYDIELGRDRYLQQERERSDAQRVTAWVSVLRPGSDSRRNGLSLHNGSTAPIYDVTIKSTGADGRAEPDVRLHVVPPGKYFIARDPDSKYHWELAEDVAALDGHVRPVMKKLDWSVSLLLFRDAAGRSWQRDGAGNLLPQLLG